MATAAPPPLSSSGDKTNGAKLSRLLIDGGTTVLRNNFDGFHPPANLAANLNANYSILNNLLRRRILSWAQWDKLFSTGDSKKFDISLLFVLLRNMCGLSPPPTGWDSMPPTSDTSLEANLARMKYLRNDLFGHVATTVVDTPTFTALWQEISVALVSLGLDQAEIDRLKAEPCGEDDCLDVLFEWFKREENSNALVKEVEKTQNKTRQTVEKANESLTQIQQNLSEVHQTQEVGHEMLHQLKQNIEEGQETHKRAFQGTEKKVYQTQGKAFLEVRQEVEKVHHTSAQTHEEIKKLQENQQEIKQAVENLQAVKENEKAEEVLKNLAKSEFKGDIEYHSDRFQAGTREWVFKAILDWLDDGSSQHRVMAISGNAGMGKSVISAVISKRMQEAGRLAGSHFCQHNNFRYRNPQLMLQSLACHLCHALPEYKSALVKQLSRNLGVELNSVGVQDLFALLFKEPLSTLPDPERNILMVIDGLDESEYEGRSELLDVVSNYFCRLPGWIRFLVTTRPERNISACLKYLNPLLLESNHENNLEDIELFFDKRLHHVIRPDHVGPILKELVRKSEGVFLYACFLVELIANNVSTLDLEHLESSLPLGISSVYLSYFKRLESEVCKELRLTNGEEKVSNLLCAVTAAREPLPLSFVSRMLSTNTSSVTARRVTNKVIGCVSALLPIHNDRLHIFHKSVKDWLTDSSSYGEHDFTVDEKEGHRILSKLCADELDEVKRRGVHSTEFSASEKYALQHGVRHMVAVDEDSMYLSMEEMVRNYVTDLELLYAKLCVNCAAAPDDVFHVKKSKRSMCLSAEVQNTLARLLMFFRRHGSILRDHSHTFFQDLLNEGGPQLSFKAADVLDSKYPDISYMEYLEKEPHHEVIKARMDCGSHVVCFDVSPQKDYMVCDCSGGTIELWSLQTSTRVWMRPAVVAKTIWVPIYRSRCQSVVFHPKGDCVLPGILSNAYTINGDWVPLFPSSCCSFLICAFSGDKTRLLTDCTNDPMRVKIWSMKNGAEMKRVALKEWFRSFAYSKDGDLVAILSLTGCVYLYDVQHSSVYLVGKVMVEICDMILFSPNSEALVCQVGITMCLISVKKICDSSGVAQMCESRQFETWQCCFWPLDSDSLSKCGFLTKNRTNRWFEYPLRVPHGRYFSMIDEGTALITGLGSKQLTLLNVEEARVDYARPWDKATGAFFSFDGANVYMLAKPHPGSISVSVLDVSSRKVKVQNSFTSTSRLFPVIPMNDGVLLLSENRSPELWNEDVSQCVRTFPQLSNIESAVPVSEEVVACGRSCIPSGFKVDVLNTSSGEIISSSIIPVSGDVRLLGCNSQYQCFIYKRTCNPVEKKFPFEGLESHVKVSCWDKTSKLWETSLSSPVSPYLSGSLRDDFVVMLVRRGSHDSVLVLDARTGATVHTFLKGCGIIDCKFLSDGHSLVCCSEVSVWLFNVRSGELLSVLYVGDRLSYVSACRQKPLIAVGTRPSGFKLMRVHLPRLEENAKKTTERKRFMEEECKKGEGSIKCKSDMTTEESINLEAATGAQNEGCPPKLSFALPRLSDMEPLSKPWNEVKLPIDAVLLTVNDCEFLSCYVYLKDRFRSYYRGLGFVDFGTMGQGQVTAALLKCGSASPGGSLIVVKNAADVLRPKLVISVGTCGSLRPKEAKLGDVVLAAKLTTYAREEVRNDRVVSCGVRTLCSRDTADLIKHAAFGWKAPLENPNAREITVHSCSEVLSGPELVNCGWRKEELIQQHPTATAIEMEGEGVFAAAYDLKMEWLVVKGISNHADGTDTETAPWKKFASVMAASIVCHMLKDPVVLRDWPHYKN